MLVVKPVIHGIGIRSEGEGTTVNQRLVVLRSVSDEVQQLAHDANLKGMVVIRSPGCQLIPFKPHRFGKPRLLQPDSMYTAFKPVTDYNYPWMCGVLLVILG